jgi:hypothetical protein
MSSASSSSSSSSRSRSRSRSPSASSSGTSSSGSRSSDSDGSDNEDGPRKLQAAAAHGQRRQRVTTAEDTATTEDDDMMRAMVGGTAPVSRPVSSAAPKAPIFSTATSQLHPNHQPSSSCHQCKVRRDDHLLSRCRNQKPRAPAVVRSSRGKLGATKACRKQYCRSCLAKYHVTPADVERDGAHWKCPACDDRLGGCKCSSCQRGRKTSKKAPLAPPVDPRASKQQHHLSRSSPSAARAPGTPSAANDQDEPEPEHDAPSSCDEESRSSSPPPRRRSPVWAVDKKSQLRAQDAGDAQSSSRLPPEVQRLKVQSLDMSEHVMRAMMASKSFVDDQARKSTMVQLLLSQLRQFRDSLEGLYCGRRST